MKKFTAKIVDRKLIAEMTYEVVFELEADDFSFMAGQYVEVIIPELLFDDGTGNARDFAIVPVPGFKKRISIVFLASESGFKRSLINFPIGQIVKIRGPLGYFVLPENSEREIVFVADGIGIVPFISMADHATEVAGGLKVILLYTCEKSEQVIFADKLNEISQKNKNFKFILKEGQLEPGFIKKSVGDLKEKLWYVAGTPLFVGNILKLLNGFGIREDRIIIEEMTGYDHEGEINKNSSITDHNETSIDIKSLFNTGGSIIGSPILDMLSRSALVSVTDTQGTILYVNDFVVETSKYSREELIGQNHRILKTARQPSTFYKAMWNTISSGNVWRGEIQNRAKDGTLYWVDSSIAPIFGKKGEITHYVAVRFLITEKKEAEEALKLKTETLEVSLRQMRDKEKDLENIKKATFNILEDLDLEKKEVEQKVIERTKDIELEKSKLLQVTNNMKGGSVLFNENKEVVFVNEKMYELIKAEHRDGGKGEILTLLNDYFNELGIMNLLADCFEGRTFTIPEVESKGRIFEMSFISLDGKGSGDSGGGYFFLTYDVTDAKLLERSKSKLVAVASHQLRTPLTAMRGNIEMLIDESYGPLNNDQHEMLSDINVSTERLISMVNDMLDITKIEQGDMEMEMVLINVKEIVESIQSDLSDYAERRGVSIIPNVPEDLVVYGDKVRVRQVFQNLIDNAIKYGKNPGKLEISSLVEGDFAEIIFKDDGVGIPEMEQSRIFGRFYRASNTANVSNSGSGLGLYIVRSIVGQLGGDIWFESEENVGTTFFFTLPIREIKAVE